MSVIQPGLLVLHGNRLEFLRDAVFDWLGRAPLEPLEEEHFLVQSNGAAEWLKMALARTNGICAATRVELPGRFLWRIYRRMLGRQQVLPQSALEKEALTWRLMRVLPTLLDRTSFASVAGFLAGDDADRRLQLARRLADLYDQYQVYRADWLDAWEKGRPVLDPSGGQPRPVPAEQRWQVDLWRHVVAELGEADRRSTRPHVHHAFMDAMAAGREACEPLPRRVVLFGAAQIPAQMLEALAALATRLQVIVAVPNPCRYHWADIIEGREALVTSRQRLPASEPPGLSAVPFDAMHLHAHPLLAAWGRQGRDFMRQLDAFDDADDARRRFALPRIDLFDDGPGLTLLEQVQANIRDLVPLAEHPRQAIPATDRSIVFQVAHGALREVEILHDQLLAMLSSPGLSPRDIVVMVPDIERFAPAVRAVFGQHDRGDARFIPFDIADLRSRGSNVLVVALEWLLHVPDERIRLQDLRDLLDVPAIAARLGIERDALPGLFAWLAGAGVRWGLHAAHRTHLGLAAAGEQNSWLFGLRRMLLGYASGASSPFDGIEPYDEIGGLDAAGVGSLIDLFERLDAWWSLARTAATPIEWARRGRGLIGALVAATDERERLTVAALQAALSEWLEACELARFDDVVPLSVLREGWLAGVDGLDASRRFLTGGVTFCTLMPLRAVPFEVVCLLGMNDGDFPRQGAPSDFDLMALAGQQRPGDRSRRDDDRYLMLEALLSARRVLSVSWSGRSARDNAVQPPSVLVSQLRDYLAAGWIAAGDGDVLDERTTAHPLQPFSRRYFEGDRSLVTFAREWRAAHGLVDRSAEDRVLPPPERDGVALTVVQLARFLRNPVKAFFRARLGVQPGTGEALVDDDEAFALDGLQRHQLRAALLEDPAEVLRSGLDVAMARRLDRVVGAGRLPMFGLGARIVEEAAGVVRPMLERWVALRDRYPQAAPRRRLRLADADVVVDDWLDGLRSDDREGVWIALTASSVVEDDGETVKPARLLDAWVRLSIAASTGAGVAAVLVGPDATLVIRSPDPDDAVRDCGTLLRSWREGMVEPLPFASKTALARVADVRNVREIYEGGHGGRFGEGDEFCLKRVYPDFEKLTEDGRFADHAERLFQPLVRWVGTHVTVVPCAGPLPSSLPTGRA